MTAALYEILWFVLPLVAMLVVGMGFWALGQWLRRKGHGELLDRIDTGLGKFQKVAGRTAKPLSGPLIGFIRGFNRIPILGNKRGRAVWDEAVQKTPPDQDK